MIYGWRAEGNIASLISVVLAAETFAFTQPCSGLKGKGWTRAAPWEAFAKT
jgi:hypothetical protein